VTLVTTNDRLADVLAILRDDLIRVQVVAE